LPDGYYAKGTSAAPEGRHGTVARGGRKVSVLVGGHFETRRAWVKVAVAISSRSP